MSTSPANSASTHQSTNSNDTQSLGDHDIDHEENGIVRASTPDRRPSMLTQMESSPYLPSYDTKLTYTEVIPTNKIISNSSGSNVRRSTRNVKGNQMLAVLSKDKTYENIKTCFSDKQLLTIFCDTMLCVSEYYNVQVPGIIDLTKQNALDSSVIVDDETQKAL